MILQGRDIILRRNFYKRMLIIVLIVSFIIPCPLNASAQANVEKCKLIRTFEQDTTGDKIIDKVKILADTKNEGYVNDGYVNEGYVVEIEQHGERVYQLKPANGFDYLASYKPFWNIGIQIADINNDNVPEIITWGNMTHENPIHIFRWDGCGYKIVYSGFDTGFDFKDITGDNVLELVIHDRIYGTGEERTYYQWQKSRYVKIYYEMDGNRGFDKIQYLLDNLCDLHADKSAYESSHFEDWLADFTDKWLADKKNIDYVKKFGKKTFSIQIIKYLNDKIEFDAAGNAIEDTWRLKVRAFIKDSAKITPQDMVMTVTTRYIDNSGWIIDYINISD